MIPCHTSNMISCSSRTVSGNCSASFKAITVCIYMSSVQRKLRDPLELILLKLPQSTRARERYMSPEDRSYSSGGELFPPLRAFLEGIFRVSKDLCRAAPTSMLAKSTWGAKDHDDICTSQFPPVSPSHGTRNKNGEKGKKNKKNKNKILNKYIRRWWWSPQPIHQQLPLLLLTKLPKLSLCSSLNLSLVRGSARTA